jgi:hypothetical protein
MPVAQPTPMRDPRGVPRPIEVTPAATRAQHAQDPWEQLQIRIRATASRSAWWFREAFGNEGKLPRREDIAREDRRHGRAPQRTGELRSFSGLGNYETGSRNRFQKSSRSALTGAGIGVGWEDSDVLVEPSCIPFATGPDQAPTPCLPCNPRDPARERTLRDGDTHPDQAGRGSHV